MAWFFIIVNFYFDYAVAVMLGCAVGFLMAWAGVRLRFMEPHVIIHRFFAYFFMIAFTFLFCVTYAASKTDPDFSVKQRYRYALQTVRGWFYPHDPLLERGGLEQALRMTTDWVAFPEQVFYARGPELYSVMTNGEERRLRFSAPDAIEQALFSPDGQSLAVKTRAGAAVLNVSSDEVRTVYDGSAAGSAADQGNIVIGGLQWSPDSRRLCFFIQKSSRSASHTSWFVYDQKSGRLDTIDLGARQNVFLFWGEDSRRLYFSQTRAVEEQGQQGFRARWFEIVLEPQRIAPAADIFCTAVEPPDDMLRGHGVMIVRPDRRLRLERCYGFGRQTPAVSPSGRRIMINKKQQMCYQSGYGVRYCLFGLETIGRYLNFPPEGRENELLVQDARWLPSGKYLLLKHYTHGLLVLQPLARRAGVLAEGDIELFGVYPGRF